MTSAAELVAAMRALKHWSGLTYRQLQRRAAHAGDTLPHSTIGAVLGRSTLPREDLLAAFVRACGGDEDAVDAWRVARRRVAVAAVLVPTDGSGATGETEAADGTAALADATATTGTATDGIEATADGTTTDGIEATADATATDGIEATADATATDGIEATADATATTGTATDGTGHQPVGSERDRPPTSGSGPRHHRKDDDEVSTPVLGWPADEPGAADRPAEDLAAMLWPEDPTSAEGPTAEITPGTLASAAARQGRWNWTGIHRYDPADEVPRPAGLRWLIPPIMYRTGWAARVLSGVLVLLLVLVATSFTVRMLRDRDSDSGGESGAPPGVVVDTSEPESQSPTSEDTSAPTQGKSGSGGNTANDKDPAGRSPATTGPGGAERASTTTPESDGTPGNRIYTGGDPSGSGEPSSPNPYASQPTSGDPNDPWPGNPSGNDGTTCTGLVCSSGPQQPGRDCSKGCLG